MLLHISAFIESGTESTDKIHFCGQKKKKEKKIKVTMELMSEDHRKTVLALSKTNQRKILPH